MKFTVRAITERSFSGLSMLAADAKQAVRQTNVLLKLGVPAVEIIGEDGRLYDVAQLARLARRIRPRKTTIE